MKKLITTLLILSGIFISSAQSVNAYKYVLIPETFEFLGKVDEYRLNSFLKFQLEKEGFNTLMTSDQKPADLLNNPCSALNANLKSESGLFVTKIFIELKDCKGKVVFRGKEGRSRNKGYQAAYQEALKDAFSSIEELDYQYDPNLASGNTEEMNEKPAEVIVVGIVKPEEKKVEAPIQKNSDGLKTQFIFENKIYLLKENNQGFELFQNGSTEPLAYLIESEIGSSYIYNSLTKQGIAYFDSENNLIVEYYDQGTKKKVVLKYELKD